MRACGPPRCSADAQSRCGPTGLRACAASHSPPPRCWPRAARLGNPARSKLAQQHDDAAEMHEAEVGVGLVLPASGDASELLEPSEESLDLPTPLVTAQRPSILPALMAVAALGGDQLDVTLVAQAVCQLLAVEGLVSDQLRREVFDERFVEGLVDQSDVVSRPISDSNGERKTSAVCKRHDLRRIAGTAAPDAGSPFFAGA
jgi:hypothetical protein